MKYLKNKSLVENRAQVFTLDFGLILLLLVRQQENFNVGVWGSSHVHGSEVLSLEDPHYELQQKEKRIKRDVTAENWKLFMHQWVLTD